MHRWGRRLTVPLKVKPGLADTVHGAAKPSLKVRAVGATGPKRDCWRGLATYGFRAKSVGHYESDYSTFFIFFFILYNTYALVGLPRALFCISNVFPSIVLRPRKFVPLRV